VSWQIEQADEFREEVERYSDAERVILADAYQALDDRFQGQGGQWS